MKLSTATPAQHSKSGILIKKFLHTKLGAFIGFHAGISGFNRIDMTVTKGDKVTIGHSYNSRVNAGAALTASLLSGSTLGGISSPSPAKYIALSTSTLTPASGDTTLSGETAVSGLTRVSATTGSYTAPVSLDGSASYVLSNTFTAGGSATILSAAIFDAASSGNMLVEGNLATSAPLGTGDTVAISWTINL